MYTSRAEVESQGLVPGKYPWSDAVADEKYSTWVRNASSEIDSEVGMDYPVLPSGRKFEQHPDTPQPVVLAASWLVASYALTALGVNARVGDSPPMWVQYRNMAEKKIRGIRDKKVDLFGDESAELDTAVLSPVTVMSPAAATHRPNIFYDTWGTAYW